MLSFYSKISQVPGDEYIVCTNKRTGETVAVTRDDEAPLQSIGKRNIVELVGRSAILKIMKRYSLKNEDMNLLISFYEDRDTEEIDLRNDFKLLSAFNDLEDLLSTTLKTKFYSPTADFDLHFTGEVSNGSTTNSLILAGISSTGKSWMAAEIIGQFYRDCKLYIITPQPEDSSIQRLFSVHGRKKDKDTWFLDINKITRRIHIESDFSQHKKHEKILIYVDDALDVEIAGKDGVDGSKIRANIASLCKDILTKGRHHNMMLVLTLHDFQGGRQITKLFRECPNLIVFLGTGNRNSNKELLKRKVGLPKADIDQVFDISKGSRWTYIRTAQPTFACSKKGVVLL